MALRPWMRNSRGADRWRAEELEAMGTHHGNDGNPPPDGDRTPDPELPDLPPEWGEIAIPDDLSGLAREVEQVREELAREKRRRGRPGRPVNRRPDPRRAPGPAAGADPAARPGSGAGADPAAGPGAGPGSEPTGGTAPTIGVPLLIMSVAVLITLVSLFMMAWSGTGAIAPDPIGARDRPAELPPIVLLDATGRQVTLAAQTPMVLMLVEECGCANLVAATAAAAPPGVTVAMVGHRPPPPPAGLGPADPVPLRLGDPGGLVRNQLRLGDPGDTATVVLVDRTGRIVTIQDRATSVAQYQAELTGLNRD
jgi:hypothetical protein